MADQSTSWEAEVDIRATKMYYIGAAAILVFDYFLTLSAEIEFGWKVKKTPVSILFFVNRYFSLFFTVITIASYFSPLWTQAVCNKYAITQFVHTVLSFTIAEVFLTLRVYALSYKNYYICGVLILHILAQLGLAFYNLSLGGTAASYISHASQLNKTEFQLCAFFPNRHVLNFDIAYLCLALSFYAVAFIGTITFTMTTSKAHPTWRWVRIVQRDGMVYFIAIFSSTLVWTILILHASSPRLGLINAEPDLIFTAIMVNRLYLSLKRAGHKSNLVQETWLPQISNYERSRHIALQVIVAQQVTSTVL
ncbi:hypothetical protein BDQ12DRAFT_678457 [Crucibulum laeve]|uniref:DUF6533 domain-containing protein n=1 Tax=Crucibulum laeve TaxID=68775 RepID=A0A5C3MA57_9AGAR|nr:hypothetical protein BDQ12DRAFT_678457 [Crucibulum laeve]